MLLPPMCYFPTMYLYKCTFPSRSKKGTCLTTTLIPAGQKEPQSGTAFRTLDRFGLSPWTSESRGGSKKSVNGAELAAGTFNFRFPVLTCSLMAGPGDVIGPGTGEEEREKRGSLATPEIPERKCG